MSSTIKTYNITREIANLAHHKCIRDAFEKDELRIGVTDDNIFCIEKCDSDSLREIAIRETKRIHPEYVYNANILNKEREVVNNDDNKNN